MDTGAYYVRRFMLAIFFLLLSLLLTLLLMAFIFPIFGSVSNQGFSSNVLLAFIIASIVSNSLVFLHFSIRYGVPFRGGDFWTWLIGDEKLGRSVKNGIIGSLILISVFSATVVITMAVKSWLVNSLISAKAIEGVNFSLDFLISVVPAYEITNIFFINFFFSRKEITFFRWVWKPLKVEFDKISSLISLTDFLLVSVLICYRLLMG